MHQCAMAFRCTSSSCDALDLIPGWGLIRVYFYRLLVLFVFDIFGQMINFQLIFAYSSNPITGLPRFVFVFAFEIIFCNFLFPHLASP